jgi:leader peptidase (prepilin peptidase)/N-methyltransferase
MLIPLWLVTVFLVGIAVGSFLNVCIARLPLEKSILWPGSRCGNCLQPIRWYDNLPLVSYLWLRGRCRTCQQPFAIRYFLVELLTGLGFLALFYVEVILNIHQWPVVFQFQLADGLFPWEWWVGWGYHAILFALLLAVSVCDLDRREIPMQLTLLGTLIGLIGSVVFAWPWPYTPAQALAPVQAAQVRLGNQGWWALPMGVGPLQGLYPWPVWGPLPKWLPPGSWQCGLATGLAGALAGMFFMRAMAFLFSKGLGMEALGLGDADMMMMVGAFLGWQLVLVAILVSSFPGLVVAMGQLLFRRDLSLPYGPALAVGVLITMLCWRWIGPQVQILFFWPIFMLCLLVVGGTFMLGASYLFRLAPWRQGKKEEA